MEDNIPTNNRYKNKISIPLLTLVEDLTSAEAGGLLDKLEKQQIEYVLWKEPAIVPEVSFTLAYTKEALFIKFNVTEPASKPLYKNINDPVYRDSCVEVFIAISKDETYYNLEFNALGTCLGQTGSTKDNREFISPVILGEISSYTEMRESEEHMHSWQLTLKVPFVVFIHHDKTAIVNRPLRLNFFKCGDDLPNRHHMAWNEVKSDEPNFHQIEYFGEGFFEKV